LTKKSRGPAGWSFAGQRLDEPSTAFATRGWVEELEFGQMPGTPFVSRPHSILEFDPQHAS
jgi:hypothetical protein